MRYVEGKTFEELRVGDRAEFVCPTDQLAGFARLLGACVGQSDTQGATKDAGRARDTVPGVWAGALIPAAIAAELPGPDSQLLRESLSFHGASFVAGPLAARLTVRTKDALTRHIVLDCQCLDNRGTLLLEGTAEVIPPAVKSRRLRVTSEMPLPAHELGARYRQLIEAARALGTLRTAVVYPCDGLSLSAALEAMTAGLIVPILVGPQQTIRTRAQELGLDLQGAEIVDVPHSAAAAECAVRLAGEGKAHALMKGALHTDEFMAAVLARTAGLRTGRRMSHVFALDVPHYPKPLFITDAALNIAPDLNAKRDIAQNAIDLAHVLHIETPKVAILSAVETVSAKIPSTIDAAALCKMAERGQISGAVLDGPLAFDNAISTQAAHTKGIRSAVAGEADILLVPDLEAGNMLAKQLIYLAGAESAGIVLGARIPIMLTSRADGETSRLASCALAHLAFDHQL
jgi:phosphate acetyltransferase